MLWPFKKDKPQKVIGLVVLIIGFAIVFNTSYITLGAGLSLFGLLYLLDAA